MKSGLRKEWLAFFFFACELCELSCVKTKTAPGLKLSTPGVQNWVPRLSL